METTIKASGRGVRLPKALLRPLLERSISPRDAFGVSFDPERTSLLLESPGAAPPGLPRRRRARPSRLSAGRSRSARSACRRRVPSGRRRLTISRLLKAVPDMSRPRDEIALQAVGWAAGCRQSGCSAWSRGLRMTRAADVLSGASILTGFLFGTLVFVFQLRLRVTDDPHIPSFGRLRRLIDRSYGRLTAAVVAALLTTIVGSAR